MQAHRVARFFLGIAVFVAVASLLSDAQVNVTTWHNDNYRTGQNTNETTLTPSNVSGNSFGLVCTITPLPQSSDGFNQIYAQPLVVWNGASNNMTVYIATLNDYVYAYTVPAAANWNAGSSCSSVATSVVSRNLLDGFPGEQPAYCGDVGSNMCGTVGPNVGVLGTPVIDTSTNTLYLVAESETTDKQFFYHRVHALDASTLANKTAYNSPATILNGTKVGQATFESQSELQRPGLLLLPSSSPVYPATLYAAFSMMDGTHPQPSGWIFAYDAANLGNSLFPLAYPTTPDLETVKHPNGGIWQGGAGLATGTDENGGTYLYFSTANGNFDLTTTGGADTADSFVKLTTNLQISDYFTPSDQCYRDGNDIDYGSGGGSQFRDLGQNQWF